MDDNSQSFSMNYHTLAATDDVELHNPTQSTVQNTRKNTQEERTDGKSRRPLRRSLSAQHRAIKVRTMLIIYARNFVKENVRANLVLKYKKFTYRQIPTPIQILMLVLVLAL